MGPAQEAIRRIFLEHIVHRKGLDGALAHLDGIVLPTPAAVLRAAALLGKPAGPGPRTWPPRTRPAGPAAPPATW